MTYLYVLYFNSPVFSKVRTINFSSCDDDIDGYDPELYILKNVINRSKVLNNCNLAKTDEKINSDDTDENKSQSYNDSNTCSDDESYKSDKSSTCSDQDKSYKAGKSTDVPKKEEEEDVYGPTFFQKSTHWVCKELFLMNVDCRCTKLNNFTKLFSLSLLRIG